MCVDILGLVHNYYLNNIYEEKLEEKTFLGVMLFNKNVGDVLLGSSSY